ncbi:MAG TPA: hypothetical protein VJ860_05295 [Polyangia bacterium]|nr:hypothetical protein [Polyangia bacterium]
MNHLRMGIGAVAVIGLLIWGCGSNTKNPTDAAVDRPLGNSTNAQTGGPIASKTVTGADTVTTAGVVTSVSSPTNTIVDTEAGTGVSTGIAIAPNTTGLSTGIATAPSTTGLSTGIATTPNTTGLSTGIVTGMPTATGVSTTGPCISTDTDDGPHWVCGRFTCGINGGTPCPIASPTTCCVRAEACIDGKCMTSTSTVTATVTCTQCGFACCRLGETCGGLTATSDGYCYKTVANTNTWTSTGT